MFVFRNISKFFPHEGIQSPSLSIFLLLFFYYLNASRHLPTNIDRNSGVYQERIVGFYTITSFALLHYIIVVSREMLGCLLPGWLGA